MHTQDHTNEPAAHCSPIMNEVSGFERCSAASSKESTVNFNLKVSSFAINIMMIPKWSLLQIEAFTYFTQIYLRVLSSSINIAYVKCHFMLYCWRGSRCDAQNKMLRPTLFTVKKNFSLQLTAEIFSTGPSRFVWWHLKPSIEKVILNINIWYHWYHISLPGEFWYKFIFCV